MEGGVDACLNGTAGGAVCHVSADIACICVWGGDHGSMNGTAGGAVCHVSADIACICVWGGTMVP